MASVYQLDIVVVEAKNVPQTGVKDEVLVASAFSGRATECLPASVKTSAGRATWLNGRGLLTWTLSESRLRKLRSGAPCIKLNLISRPETAAKGQTVGGVFLAYALCPLQLDALPVSTDGRPSFDGWLPLAGLHEAKLKVTATLRVVSVDVPPSPVHGGRPARAGGRAADWTEPGEDRVVRVHPGAVVPSDHASVLSESHSSLSRGLPSFSLDAIPIGDRGDGRFALTIHLTGISELSARVGGRLTLSYRLFGVLVSTERWDAGGRFPGTRDSFMLRSCLPDLALFLASLPPLHVELCTQEGRGLGTAAISMARLVEAMPPSCAPTFVEDDGGGGYAEPAHLDPSAEAVFGGSEMQGGFTLQGEAGTVGTLTASVTLTPLDEEAEAVLRPGGGVAGVQVLGDVPQSAWGGGYSHPPQQQQAWSQPPYAPHARTFLVGEPTLRSSAALGADAALSPLADLPTEASVAGLLYLTPVELDIVAVHLVGAPGGGHGAPVRARVNLRYEALFFPPAGCAPGQAELIRQEHVQHGVRVTNVEVEDSPVDDADDAAPVTLRLPSEYVLGDAGAARFPLTPPGTVTFQLLEDGDSGADDAVSAVAQGGVPAAALGLAAKQPAGPVAPFTLLRIPLFACAAGDDGGEAVAPGGGNTTPSIGHVVVRVWAEEEKEVEYSAVRGSAAGAYPLPLPGTSLPSSFPRTTSAGEGVATSTGGTQTSASAGTQTDGKMQQAYSSGTLSVSARGSTPSRPAPTASMEGGGSPPPSPVLKVSKTVGTAAPPVYIVEELEPRLTGRQQSTAAVPAGQQPAAPAPSLSAHPVQPDPPPPARLTVNPRPLPQLSNPYTGEADARRWRLSIDLRSLRDVSEAGAYFVRFGYAHLAAAVAKEAGVTPGSQASVPVLRTRPAVHMTSGAERLLPSSFASFTFVLSGGTVSRLLADHPVVMELFRATGTGGAGDKEQAAKAGAGKLQLADILLQPAVLRCPITHRTFAVEGEYELHANALRASGQHSAAALASLPHPALMRTLDLHVPVDSGDAKATRHAAALRVVAFLDDMGPVQGGHRPGSLGHATAGEEALAGLILGGTALQATVVPATDAETLSPGRAASRTAPVPPAAPHPPSPQHPPPGHTPARASAPVSQESVRTHAPGQSLAQTVSAFPVVLPSTGVPSGQQLSADTLLALPAVRSQVDSLVARLVAREEDALLSWRRAQEEAWVKAKGSAEEAWRREAEERERARMRVLEGAWADREAERQAVHAEATDRIRHAEGKLRGLTKEVDVKMREVERAKEDSARAEDARQSDHAATTKRFKEDAEHTLTLCRQREAAAAERVAQAQADADAARARAADVEAALASARQAVLTGPNEALRDAVAATEAEAASLRSALADAHARAEAQRVAKEEARAHVLRLAAELARLRESAASEKEASLQKLRVAWLAREERYVLDGDREALRDIQRQAEAVRAAVGRTAPPGGDEARDAPRSALPPPPSPFPSSSPSLPVGLSTEDGSGPPPQLGLAAADAFESSGAAAQVVVRLKVDRKALLASEQPFTAGHPLVRRIDRALLAAEVAQRQLAQQGR